MPTSKRPIKTILVISILFSLLALPALSQLRDADLDKIRLIVKDEIAESEKRFDEKLRASEERMKEHVVEQSKVLKDYISQEIKATNVQFVEIDKRIRSDSGWTKFLLTTVVAIIGIPTAIILWRSRKDRTLEKQIETLAQEIEILKQRQIVQ